MIKLFFRKIRSGIYRSIAMIRSLWIYFFFLGDSSIIIASGCSFGRWTLLRATDGGTIRIGSQVSLGRNVQLIAQGGDISIGAKVHIGDGSIIVCRENINIGADSLIAEYTVIRDQDHEVSRRPIRTAGFRTLPIHIGCDVWVGSKATILRGVTIGDGAVVGAHAVVKKDIPAGALGVGVPARVVRLMEE